jgi:DeoR/GlpR family transcriptional regulator of sugar metabolism
MIQNAQQRIVVADSTKIGRTTFTAVAPLTVANTLVTDSDIDRTMVKALQDLGIEVMVAKVGD